MSLTFYELLYYLIALDNTTNKKKKRPHNKLKLMLPNTEAANGAPKLIKFEESNFDDVLREVAWAKTKEEKTLLKKRHYCTSFT